MTSEVNSLCIIALMSVLCCACVATETETADTSGRVTTTNISPAFTFSEYNTIICGTRVMGRTAESEARARRLYILCWREHSRRKLSPTLATPTTLALTTLVAQCELSMR